MLGLSDCENQQSNLRLLYFVNFASICFLRRELISQFENAYLSRSVSRLLDPVNLMFSETKAPTHENVDGLVRTITRFVVFIQNVLYKSCVEVFYM